MTITYRVTTTQYFLSVPETEIHDWLSGDSNTMLPELLKRTELRRIFTLDTDVYNSDFRRFFENHLVQQVQCRFFEYLQIDSPENIKAWRAFQRLLLEILRANQEALAHDQQAGFQDISTQLAQLQATLNNLPETGRQPNEPFADGLNAVHEELSRIAADIQEVKQSGQTINAIDVTTQETHQDVQVMQQELREISDCLKAGGLVGEGVKPISVDVKDRFIPLINRHIELFAGRKKQLEEIEDILATREKGYIFVTALSGYGKTALLANLVNQHKEQFYYHFLSRLDHTEEEPLLLRNLCSQLCCYYGIGGGLPQELEKLKALYSRLLALAVKQSEQPVIVVIDGIDEAPYISDLHIPRKLPEGKCIIFSARQQTGRDYLTELRLPTEQVYSIELTGLDEPDIRGLLQQAGERAAAFASDEHIRALLTISRGDPFYLNFLVQDIREGKVTPDNLVQMPTGLESYLDQQFEQLWGSLMPDEKDVQKAFLGFLLVAKDKLRRKDLIALTAIDGGDFVGVVKPLTRFLIKVGDAYTLCHPRFADHFRKTIEQTITRYTTQLLAYCQQWPQHRSPYALHYYPAHLLDAKQYETLFALARDDKFRTMQAAEFPDIPDLPLRTICTALQGAADSDNAAQMAEFLIAHARQTEHLKHETPLEALRAGQLERTWGLADGYESAERFAWYLLLAWELNDNKRLEDARRTLQHGVTTLPKNFRFQGAPELLIPMYDIDHKSFGDLHQKGVITPATCQQMVEMLIAQQRFDTAHDISQRFQMDRDRIKSFTTCQPMVETLIAQQRLEEAYDISSWFQPDGDRIKSLSALACAYLQQGKADEAQQRIAEALKIARGTEEMWKLVALQACISLETAVTLAHQHEDALGFRSLLGKTLKTFSYEAKTRNRDDAFNIALQIAKDKFHLSIFQKIMELQVKARDIPAALETWQHITDETTRTETILKDEIIKELRSYTNCL